MTSAPHGPTHYGYAVPLTCGPAARSLSPWSVPGRHRLRQACRHLHRGGPGRPGLGHRLRRRLRHRRRRAPRHPDRRRGYRRRAGLRSRRPLPPRARRAARGHRRPPGRQPSRLRFLARNRIIAALARGTVVIEAAERSGTLATALHASDLSRPLMAVPGPITSMTSAGCNALIRDHLAACVTSADDIIAGTL